MDLELKHHPVMVDQVISYLDPKNSEIYVDCTFGQGGYSQKILKDINCKVVAIDRDSEVKKYATILERKYSNNFTLSIDKFSNIEKILKKNKIEKINGIIFDLGLSNTQLNNPERGFSFQFNGPLDMRMDKKNIELNAKEVINEYDQKQLSDIFYYYGNEKNSRKIAKKIIEKRKKKEIETTFDLVELIKTINFHKQKHPATRVFQALRIFVNDELNELDYTLKKSLSFLKKNSKIITVAFHSLEDSIIKGFFIKNKSLLKILTKKPIRPSNKEITLNPRSRSAKMRVAEIL